MPDYKSIFTSVFTEESRVRDDCRQSVPDMVTPAAADCTATICGEAADAMSSCRARLRESSLSSEGAGKRGRGLSS